VTIVVDGAAPAEPTTDPEALAALVATQEQAGVPRKQAIGDVARSAGVPKRLVYDAVHRPGKQQPVVP
jgi:16S rRNA (cytidine1402-2'-O)-methyltransferase